jgi:hypothetical protein
MLTGGGDSQKDQKIRKTSDEWWRVDLFSLIF